MSKVIKGGTIITADRSYTADVKIDGDIISESGENLSGDEIVDASSCFVMPGGIDPHTHLEMPFMGTTTAETWESGTFAALSGGTTTIIDMIVPDERGLLVALDEWLSRANRQASCDFGFHMSITNWSEQIFNEMADVVSKGLNTFKHFMAYKGGQSLWRFISDKYGREKIGDIFRSMKQTQNAEKGYEKAYRKYERFLY